MKKTTILFLFLINCFAMHAQDFEAMDKIRQGMQQHDLGNYDEAIAIYQSLIEKNKNNYDAHYEIAGSYFAKKNYQKAIDHCDLVIKKSSANVAAAYILKGSAQDLSGKPKDAIKTYKKGLKDFPEKNLLWYNLALTQFNEGNIDEALDAVQHAINAQPNHSSSHLLLYKISSYRNERVKAILSLYYFLHLERSGNRSVIAYQDLQKLLDRGVEQKDEKTIEVKIGMPDKKSKDSELDFLDFYISILQASRYTSENKNKSDEELFAENTRSIFAMLDKNDDAKSWWKLYTTFFADVNKEALAETYAYYISKDHADGDVNKWLDENTTKVKALELLLSKNFYAPKIKM